MCFVLVSPAYSGARWSRLPNLAAGLTELARLLESHVEVVRVPVDTPDTALKALRTTAQAADQLIVYVGGHGVVDGGDHFTALDDSSDQPDSLDSLWTRQLARVQS